MAQERKTTRVTIWQVTLLLNQIKARTASLSNQILQLLNSPSIQFQPKNITKFLQFIKKISDDLCLDLDSLTTVEKDEYSEAYQDHTLLPTLHWVEGNLMMIRKKIQGLFPPQISTPAWVSSIHTSCECLFQKIEKIKHKQLRTVSLSDEKASGIFSFQTQPVTQESWGMSGSLSRFFVRSYEEARRVAEDVEELEELLRKRHRAAEVTQKLVVRIRPGTPTYLLKSGLNTKEEVESLFDAAMRYVEALKGREHARNIELLAAICMAIVATELFVHFHLEGGLTPALREKLESLSQYVQYLSIVKGVSGFGAMESCLKILSENLIPSDESATSSVSLTLANKIRGIASSHSVLLGETVFEEKFKLQRPRSCKLVGMYRETRGKAGSALSMGLLEQLLQEQYANAECTQQLVVRISPGRYTGLLANSSHTAAEVEILLNSAIEYFRAVEINHYPAKIGYLPAICTAILTADTFMWAHQNGKNPRLVEQLRELSNFVVEVIKVDKPDPKDLGIYRTCVEIAKNFKSEGVGGRELIEALQKAMLPQRSSATPPLSLSSSFFHSAAPGGIVTSSPSPCLLGS